MTQLQHMIVGDALEMAGENLGRIDLVEAVGIPTRDMKLSASLAYIAALSVATVMTTSFGP